MSPPRPEWKRKLRTTELEKTAERDLWSGRLEEVLGPLSSLEGSDWVRRCCCWLRAAGGG